MDQLFSDGFGNQQFSVRGETEATITFKPYTATSKPGTEVGIWTSEQAQTDVRGALTGFEGGQYVGSVKLMVDPTGNREWIPDPLALPDRQISTSQLFYPPSS